MKDNSSQVFSGTKFKSSRTYKVALFGLLTMALGSSLSWNPENTQIARNVIGTTPDYEEVILASTAETASDRPNNDTKNERRSSEQEETLSPEQIKQIKMEIARDQAAREDLEKVRLAKALRREKRKIKEFPDIKNNCPKAKGEARVNTQSILPVRKYFGAYDPSNDEEFECYSDRIKEHLESCRDRFPLEGIDDSDYSSDGGLEYVSDNEEGSESEDDKNLRKNREACNQVALKFFKTHVSKRLINAAMAGPSSPRAKQAVELATNLIDEIHSNDDLSESKEFARVKVGLTQLMHDGTLNRGKMVQELIFANMSRAYGPQLANQYASKYFQAYLGCEAGLYHVNHCSNSFSPWQVTSFPNTGASLNAAFQHDGDYSIMREYFVGPIQAQIGTTGSFPELIVPAGIPSIAGAGSTGNGQVAPGTVTPHGRTGTQQGMPQGNYPNANPGMNQQTQGTLQQRYVPTQIVPGQQMPSHMGGPNFKTGVGQGTFGAAPAGTRPVAPQLMPSGRTAARP